MPEKASMISCWLVSERLNSYEFSVFPSDTAKVQEPGLNGLAFLWAWVLVLSYGEVTPFTRRY